MNLNNLGGETKMRRLFRRGGQSTLEYLLILTAIIAALVAAKVFIQQKVTSGLSNAADEIENQAIALMNTDR